MKKILILLVVVSLIFTGCWDQKIFERIGFILNLGIESSENGELLVTYQSPAIGTGKSNAVELIGTSGSILREARTNARRRSARHLEAGKIEQVLISSELAQKGGVHDLLEVLQRDPVDPIQAWVVIVDGSPNELLKKVMTFKDKQRPSIYINQLLTHNILTSIIPDTMIYDFDITYFAPGIDPMAPMIKLTPEDIMVTGTALFSGDKMVGSIDPRQTSLLLAMMGNAKRTEYTYVDPIEEESSSKELKNIVAITLQYNKSKTYVKIIDNKPFINISLAIDGYIKEYRWNNLDNESTQKNLESHIAGLIKGDCMELLKYAQQVGSDPMGIGEIIRAIHNPYWKSVNWKDAYKDAEFNVDIEFDIKEYGSIN